jgi:hemolysin III
MPVPTLTVGIYLSTMILLFATSALFHGLPAGCLKRLFMKLDYCAIYLFIAGSHTPFALDVLSDHGGTVWHLFELAGSRLPVCRDRMVSVA